MTTLLLWQLRVGFTALMKIIHGNVNPTRQNILQYISGTVKRGAEMPSFGVCGFGTWTYSLNKIANGLSYAPNFINYSYKDEMVGDAIVKMFSALRNKKFKIDSGFSPFSYFTTIAFHAFINRIKKEKKHHEVINEYKEKVYNDLMLDANESGNGYIYVEPTGDDDNDE